MHCRRHNGFMDLVLIGMLLTAVFAVPAEFVRGAEEKDAPDAKPAAEPEPKLNQEQLEKEFAEKLSGSVLLGHFSVVGTKEDKSPAAEKYTLEKVVKMKDGYWLFKSRIQYGKNDVTVPLPLKVVWAGDTPIITLTDLTIPLMGTFTARVMIYGDRYAGTWQHDDHGGHLWGTIQKGDATGEKDPQSDSEADSKGSAKKKPKQEKFDVILTGFGESKIQVIKVVREATGLGLKDAKDLVEAAPKPLKSGLSADDAQKLKAKIEAVGGTAELK